MTERWVKATHDAGDGPVWINMAKVVNVLPHRTPSGDDGSFLVYDAEEAQDPANAGGVLFKEPPEHFIPDQDISFVTALTLIQTIARLQPDRAHGPSIVRNARIFMKWPEDAP